MGIIELIVLILLLGVGMVDYLDGQSKVAIALFIIAALSLLVGEYLRQGMMIIIC